MNQPSSAPAKSKILVVDDNSIILKTVTMKLEAAGFEAISALDGAEAVAQVRKENPDLILLDISFPPDVTSVQWDGFRIMEWLHRLDTAKKIPVIVITGSEDEKTKERAKSLGATALFLKPLEHDDLVKTIHSTLAAAK